MARLRRGEGLFCRALLYFAGFFGIFAMSLSLTGLLARGLKTRNPAAGSSVADEVMAKAEAAIDRLTEEYPRHALRDLRDLTLYADRMAGDAANRVSHYGEVLRIAHDMRGQGALFGYPAVTRCAGSLCTATRSIGADDRLILAIIRAHVAALRAILEIRAAGPADRQALTVAAGLELLVRAGRGTGTTQQARDLPDPLSDAS